MMKIFAASLTALALIGGPALAMDGAAADQRAKLEQLWAEARGETKPAKTETAESTRPFFSTSFGSTVDEDKKMNRLQIERKQRGDFGR